MRSDYWLPEHRLLHRATLSEACRQTMLEGWLLTTAQAMGLCSKHGALGECLREGCTTAARKKGRLCSKPTVKLSCADPDCDTPQLLGKFVCIKHGAFGY